MSLETTRKEVNDMLDRAVAAHNRNKQNLEQLQAEIERLRTSIKELERGEFICRQCGLRKDSEHDEPVEF